jgi:hypothetical protein
MKQAPPNRRHFPAHCPLVGRRKILLAREPIHHISHELALADRHAVIVHAPSDGAGEGVRIVFRWRVWPGWTLGLR